MEDWLHHGIKKKKILNSEYFFFVIAHLYLTIQKKVRIYEKL